MERLINQAQQALGQATALLITAGAGMGVDSGLPDFRGNTGFWTAYPPMQALGLGFVEMANPRWFQRDPALAWGFYGHRLHLYRDTVPHRGFSLLHAWGERMPHGVFVATSNVDGQFQKAGFDVARILEIHGSIHHLQCIRGCGQALWDGASVAVDVDPVTFRAQAPLPSCPSCGGLARPNILMFGDGAWDGSRAAEQEARMDAWLDSVREAKASLAVVECGAGTAVPSIRSLSETVAQWTGGTLVRINPRESQGPKGTLSLAVGALEGLQSLAG